MCVPTVHYFNMSDQTYGTTQSLHAYAHISNGSVMDSSSGVDDCKNHFTCKLLMSAMHVKLMDTYTVVTINLGVALGHQL